MIILDTLLVYRSPLTLLLVLFGPTLLPRTINFLLRRRSQPRQQPSQPLSGGLKILLTLHTLYHLYHLTSPPYDLFKSHNLPLFTTNASLRLALLGPTGSETPSDPNTRPLEELLLTRLQNADNRFNYARFGHTALLECIWCQRAGDFYLVALPGILGPYVREAVILGTMAWKRLGGEEAGRRAVEWRRTMALTLCGMCVADVASRWFWDLTPSKGDCLHLASTIHTLRTIAFLLFPIVYIYLPLPSPTSDLSTLIPVLTNAQNTLRLTGFTRTAIKRDARFRRIWSASGEEDARRNERVSQALYSDQEVREATEAAGIDVGVAREGAKRWAREGWQSLVKVER